MAAPGEPLLSVVIPTCGRPHMLGRAIESVIKSGAESCEVLVVPNGPDSGWRLVADRLSDEPRVRFLPIEERNGNRARNYGLDIARGKYVRFLDDDDYLYPQSSSQIRQLEAQHGEVCTAALDIVDEGGALLGQTSVPATHDFVSAAVGINGIRLPSSTVYRRSAIAAYQWDVNVTHAQDYVWVLDLVCRREWNWVHTRGSVGVWYQHRQARTSRVQPIKGTESAVIARLVGLARTLEREGRMSEERAAAIAAGLWYYAHRGFPYHPLYWSRNAFIAHMLSPGSRPEESVYHAWPLSAVHPIALEFAFLPLRRVTRLLRDYWEARTGSDYRRRL